MKRLVDSGARDRALPILVAANKMDIMKRRGTEQSRPQHTKNKRDVIGLKGKDFRGKDSRYEYTVSQPPNIRHIASTSGELKVQTKGHRNRFELSTYMGTGDQISYLEQFFNNDYRGSYLESLLSTEDGSHPDMEMVLLWCRRNRLIHHTVSALDGKFCLESTYWPIAQCTNSFCSTLLPIILGTGIDELMVAMMRQAMQSRVDIKTQSNGIEMMSWSILNEELDVHRRFERRRCHFLFHKCCD